MNRPDIEFIVARSLRDTAHFLDALRAPEARRERPDRFFAALAEDVPRLRVGTWTRSPAGGPVHPACVRVVEETGEALARAGHIVEQAAPPTFFEYEERSLYGAAFGFHEYLECLQDLEERLARPIGPEDVEPFLWDLAQLGTSHFASPQDIELASIWLAGWEARTLAWFDEFDLLVTPTVCEPAPPLHSLDPHSHSPLELLEKMVPHMAFTEIWNATGQPAISLPLGWSEPDALPVGVQLIARKGGDSLLMSLAAQLLPVHDTLLRRPPIHA